MAAKFKGAIDELQILVAGIESGDWEVIENGHQFRAESGAKLNWYPSTGTCQIQGPKEQREAFQAALEAALDTSASAPSSARTKAPISTSTPQDTQIFLVHGHDLVAREQLELVLHKLGLEPFVLANTAGRGLTIIEALEREIRGGGGGSRRRTRFGIVLLTPDDVGYAKKDGPEDAKPRARQNVVLEMGMLIAALGRPNVAILQKGYVDIPSDATGILYVPFNEHVREAVPKLVDRLQTAGFALDPTKIARAQQ